MTRYYGVIGNRDHIKIQGEKRPFWEFLDTLPDGWLCSLAYERTDVPTDRQTLWDCGAWSYKDKDVPAFSKNKIVTPEWAFEQYQRLAKPGDFLVAPDHMLIESLTPEQVTARREYNRHSAEAFLKLCAGSKFIPMGVIHGQTLEERLEHAAYLRGLGYEALSLGGMAARASQKRLAVEMAQAVRDVTRGAWLHILGLSAPAFMAEWAAMGIDSADGSSHFKQAFTAGAFFTQEGARLIKHQAAHFDKESGELLEPITAPECSCLACARTRNDGVDTRRYGSNQHNMGRAAHNLNMLMRAQRIAIQERAAQNTTTVYLVSCVGEKQTRPVPAGDLYTSQWFRKARSYVRNLDADWHILSAEHGLLRRDDVTAPYEKTLNTMPAAERRAWAVCVHADLTRTYPTGTRFIILAGDKYRADLVPLLEADGYECLIPMQGLGIGQQLAWLTEHTPLAHQPTLFEGMN